MTVLRFALQRQRHRRAGGGGGLKCKTDFGFYPVLVLYRFLPWVGGVKDSLECHTGKVAFCAGRLEFRCYCTVNLRCSTLALSSPDAWCYIGKVRYW